MAQINVKHSTNYEVLENTMAIEFDEKVGDGVNNVKAPCLIK
jgi:hypothetical protein